MNKCSLRDVRSRIKLAKFQLQFARATEYNHDKPRYRWTESMLYVPYNVYMKARHELANLTSYYDVYTETLYLSSWVLQDDN